MIAETIDTPDDRSSVAFWLRPEARFSDGDPVTVDDVVFSLETLRDFGRPNYRRYYGEVERIERLGERGVRFYFREPESGKRNRELPMNVGLMPVLKAADWAGKDFAETTLVAPVGSGPYVLSDFEPGRRLVFRRNPEYWANDLPVRRGVNNFDVIRYEYFRDESARFEAFKAGEVSVRAESDPARWDEGYGFPAAEAGEVLRGEIPHQRPSGMYGLVMNTRRAPFDDIKVRQAVEAVFDFEWINQTLHRGAFQRISSYFGNSVLAHSGPAAGRERELLEPFAASLPEGTLDEAWRPTSGDGSGRDRKRIRKARKLLEEAGWTVQDGALQNSEGRPMEFEIVVRSSSDEKTAELIGQFLKPLGIVARIRLVDSAQYQARLTDYDYDSIIHRWWLSLSPGSEQGFYWGSEGVNTPGTRNYMGVASQAIDSLVETLPNARTREDFLAAARAIDRVLTAGVYVVPFWYSKAARFAWWRELRFPERTAMYGFRPEVWWVESESPN